VDRKDGHQNSEIKPISKFDYRGTLLTSASDNGNRQAVECRFGSGAADARSWHRSSAFRSPTMEPFSLTRDPYARRARSFSGSVERG
jgi:hypothetical protein